VLREAVTLTAIDRAHPDLRDRVLPRMVRATYPSAEAIVAVSEGVARALSEVVRLPAERITVIHNPTIGPDVADRCAAPVAHPWFEPETAPVIVAVGRLTEQKDFATLLGAFALLRARRDARLLILGEGEERPALTALATQLGIAGDVAMPGFVPDPYPYLARAALFVLSSAWEGLPNSLIEALAAGCPVASTDCPSGPREILAGGRYGALVPVRDPRALAAAMLAALVAPVDRSSLRARAADFSVDRIAEQYLEVLEPSGDILPAAVAV
jgi:glycosyltransferase involved in cell wall biosynthesis